MRAASPYPTQTEPGLRESARAVTHRTCRARRYLEYKRSEQDVETLSRVCQAHDYFSSEKVQQKCTEAAEEGKARQAELAAAVEQAEQDKAAKKEQKSRALAKKAEDGTGEMKTLESKESVCPKVLTHAVLPPRACHPVCLPPRVLAAPCACRPVRHCCPRARCAGDFQAARQGRRRARSARKHRGG